MVMRDQIRQFATLVTDNYDCAVNMPVFSAAAK